MKPGKIHHARWLTTAICILHLYISEQSPSSKLLVVCEFYYGSICTSVYQYQEKSFCKQWCKTFYFNNNKDSFFIKWKYKYCTTSFAIHLFLCSSWEFPLAKIHDESSTIRELSYKQIMQARENSVHKNTIRIFQHRSYYFMLPSFT